MRYVIIQQRMAKSSLADGEILPSGKEVRFTGYIACNDDNELITGYMKKEPVGGESLILYLKGYWVRSAGKLLLFETTKKEKSSLAVCAYIPLMYDNQGMGYLDGVNVPYNDKYFFINGDYVALTDIGFKTLPQTQWDQAAAKVRKHLIDEKRGKLNAEEVLKCFSEPFWTEDNRLIETYPG